jgi:hypothetical protein
MIDPRWIKYLKLAPDVEAGILATDGVECWERVAAANIALAHDYVVWSPAQGRAFLDTLMLTPHDGQSCYMLALEIMPVIPSMGQTGWFGVPLSRVGDWDTQPVFVHWTHKFYEFLEIDWGALIVFLHQNKMRSLPVHSYDPGLGPRDHRRPKR